MWGWWGEPLGWDYVVAVNIAHAFFKIEMISRGHFRKSMPKPVIYTESLLWSCTRPNAPPCNCFGCLITGSNSLTAPRLPHSLLLVYQLCLIGSRNSTLLTFRSFVLKELSSSWTKFRVSHFLATLAKLWHHGVDHVNCGYASTSYGGDVWCTEYKQENYRKFKNRRQRSCAKSPSSGRHHSRAAHTTQPSTDRTIEVPADFTRGRSTSEVMLVSLYERRPWLLLARCPEQPGRHAKSC